jgi:small subunit ribosomal protein S1
MTNRNIVKKLGLSPEKLEQQVQELFSSEESNLLEQALQEKVDFLLPGTILTGSIVSQLGNDVIVEVGLKSEGLLDASEFDDPEEIEPGKQIEVLLEEVDAEGGIIVLSKRKADRIRGWERIINTRKEGDVVTGRVTRRIKGGLLVDIGVPVFLPASQVDIRKPGDISRLIGHNIECKILKIDTENRNIVVSRRQLIEEQRFSSKQNLLADLQVGQLRKGIVKNIADFGVFVDLGGLDGLLHISDMSWGRISHPSEMVQLDQEIQCIVVALNKENERVSLGLKQKTPNPWDDVDKRYPVGARVRGKVVNIMNYGVFVRLQEGVEGLVHISEMSWTKRINHPADILNLGDEIDVIVLDINKEKQEISLGMKQTGLSPWSVASQKYPVGTIVTVKVRSLTNYGAFVEVEPGIDGLVHISDLSWTKKYSHPNEILQRGQDLKCVVLSVDEEKQRISLGAKQLTEDPWLRAIPEKYIPGQIVRGTTTKLTNFGVFVELEPHLEGLLHISELADHKIEKPQDVVQVGQQIEVKILRVDGEARKIGLSLRRVQWTAQDEQAGKAAAHKDEDDKDNAAQPAGETQDETGPKEQTPDQQPQASQLDQQPQAGQPDQEQSDNLQQTQP